MTEIRRNQGPSRPEPVRPAAPAQPSTSAEAAANAQPAPAPAGDRAAVASGGVRVPGAKKALEAFQPSEPETFSSKGAKLPSEPGIYVLLRAAEGDFEVQAERAAGEGGPRTARVGVRANDKGDVVSIDAEGGLKVGGQPVKPPAETPVELAGGGAVTDWGGGYLTVDSAAGDSVSLFARGDRVDFMGQLAETRALGAADGVLGQRGGAVDWRVSTEGSLV